jgi:hypothetical protein
MDDFKGFVAKVKYPEQWIPASVYLSQIQEETRLTYGLARRLFLAGPTSKLMQSEDTGMKLNALAKYFLSIGRFPLAELYSSLALKLIPSNQASYGIAYSTFMESQYHVASEKQGLEPVNNLLGQFRHAVESIEFHWGLDHPILMTLFDKMAFLLSKAQRHAKAYEFLQKSMELSFRILGKAHVVSAGYLTKVRLVCIH